MWGFGSVRYTLFYGRLMQTLTFQPTPYSDQDTVPANHVAYYNILNNLAKIITAVVEDIYQGRGCRPGIHPRQPAAPVPAVCHPVWLHHAGAQAGDPTLRPALSAGAVVDPQTQCIVFEAAAHLP